MSSEPWTRYATCSVGEWRHLLNCCLSSLDNEKWELQSEMRLLSSFPTYVQVLQW